MVYNYRMIDQIKGMTDFFVQVFVIIVVSFIAYLAGRKAIYHIHYVQTKSDKQRGKTALLVLKNIWKYVVFFIALLMILVSFKGIGISIAIPAVVITAVLGSTLGFGAQSLFKDIIAGFSIIFENQFVEGDTVFLHGMDIEGLVKEVRLRVSIIEDKDGHLWYVPNGEIKAVKKITKVNA